MNDETFSRTTRIERPPGEVFAWHERPGAFARLCPPWERVRVVSATGGIRDGARVKVRTKVGPWWTEWEVGHRDYVPGVQFRDVQQRGPFAKWEHLHRVEPAGEGACTLTDTITWRLPGGAVSRVFARRMVERRLARLFAWRHATTRHDVELAGRYGAVPPRCILIAGGSGLIGGALIPFLQTQGHRVVRLVRRNPRGPDEIFWDPAAGALESSAMDGVDAVVNLSGENVAGGRWTPARRAAILQSRVDATRTLVQALGAAPRQPRVLVSMSAVGVYGNCGDEVVAEDHPPGHDFLAGVCQAWEAEATRAESRETRVVRLRLGVVLTPAGGALGRLLPVFRTGMGGRVGPGTQWMSWVGIDDVVGAVYHAILDPRCRGGFNVTAPEPVTNAVFTATLADVLRRPALLPVPAAALRAVFGAMADGTLLASQRVVPDALRAAGFGFSHGTLRDALRHLLPD